MHIVSIVVEEEAEQGIKMFCGFLCIVCMMIEEKAEQGD
jgi:hypothetical protein